MIKVVEFSF